MSDEITPLNIALDLFIQVPRAEHRQQLNKQLSQLYQSLAKAMPGQNISEEFYKVLAQLNWEKYSIKQLNSLIESLSAGDPVQNLCAHFIQDRLNPSVSQPPEPVSPEVNWLQKLKNWWKTIGSNTSKASAKSEHSIKPAYITDNTILPNSTGKPESTVSSTQEPGQTFRPFSHDEYETHIPTAAKGTESDN